MSGTFLALSSRLLWRLLEKRGVDAASVFREVGLNPALMDQPRARYPLDRVAMGLGRAEELVGDPCLGLDAGELWRPTDQHALGYAFCASSTLRTALQRFVRFFVVVNDAMTFSLDEDGEHATMSVEFSEGSAPLPRAAEDARWSTLIAMCRYICGDEFDPVEVRITHPAPECRARFYGLFRCPVMFDAPASQLVFKRSDLDRPLPASNRELAHSNDRILVDYLAELQQYKLVNEVRAALIDELPNGKPSEEVIAQAVYMGARTLQRRLANEGNSFSKLLDDVRKELAECYIKDQTRTVSEVSFLLGFSQVSSFSRAFRRWTGQTPTRYRAGDNG